MEHNGIPQLPPAIPVKANNFSQWLGRRMLSALGWCVEGEFPNEPKVIVALAPHTSNWDFVIAMAALMASGVRAQYLMKKEAFVWPFSRLFIWLGGVPLDRRAASNTVDQLVAQIRQRDKIWVGITPEGTRKKVSHWKTGFLRVAHQTETPVLLVAFDFKHKRLVLDGIWPVTGDYPADARAIQDYVNEHYQGRHPDRQ